MLAVTARRVIEIDWERQRQAFDPDGSLRDLYVLDTTIDDWRAVIEHLESGPYGVSFTNPHLERAGRAADRPVVRRRVAPEHVRGRRRDRARLPFFRDRAHRARPSQRLGVQRAPAP